MGECRFNRQVSDDLIEKLKNEELWKKLKNDCIKNRSLFLALRKDNISFYYRGGRLFNFDKKKGKYGFSTHIKFATQLGTDYIRQDEIKKINISNLDFYNDYKKIKRNCELFSDDEANGVSCLCKKSSYILEKSKVVLDIEIGLKDEKKESNEKKKRNYIDILLYDTAAGELRFIEAKLFKNDELWSESTPPIIEQINRYEKLIEDNPSDILEGYATYIKRLNLIFDINLKPPKRINPKVSLLIFKYTPEEEKSNKFDKLLKILANKGIPTSTIMYESDLDANTIWEDTTT